MPDQGTSDDEPEVSSAKPAPKTQNDPKKATAVSKAAPAPAPSPAPTPASKPPEKSVSEEIIRKRYKNAPVGFYKFKDEFIRITSQASFLDGMLLVIAFIALTTAFNFYPIPIAIILLLLLFGACILHPFLGLLVYTLLVFPVLMYQVPVLAWAFLFGATAILIYGYMHYRVAAFAFLISALAFSPLGYFLMIPLLIYAMLTLGNKRAVITIVLAFAIIAALSGITGIQNTGFVLYNAQSAYTALGGSSNPVLALDTGHNPSLPISNFSAGVSTAMSKFTGQATGQIANGITTIIIAVFTNPFYYFIQIAILAGTAFAIDWYATTSRSKNKGSTASLFGILYPISFMILGGYVGFSGLTLLLPVVSFVLAPTTLYVMEYYGVNTVKALEVKKQDIRMKFGEAFEDLSASNTSETFNDIGNYESTKKELQEAIIAPIEERGISRAYNIAPTKGILFFGPPGTGKTMMMRALANEIHAGFFYVKAANLISAYPGESERLITNIFTIAKKNSPCILFFDEIESLALSRNSPGVDDTHRHALSQLLIEMDGFQKISSVIIVGATNRPDLMDDAILRPGRFDRLIYMPLPDLDGRKKVLKIYFGKLPIGDDVNLDEIAEKTERYSGADLKALSESVAQIVAQDAASQHNVLEITQQDILSVVKSSKASTSLSQLDMYNKFKLDYERSMVKSAPVETEKKIGMDDVVGLDQAKKAIKEAVEIPLLHPELMKKYGIKAVNGILMFGPPGGGKTMLMRAVTNELNGVTMLELNGSDIAEAGVEQATATIKQVFDRAKENAPAVIMIDEIDGVIPSREGASEISIQITSEILKELDGIKQMSNVVLVGATNRPEKMDTAILRPGRFDKLIFVKPPTAAQRSDLFKKYLTGVPGAEGVDYTKLGTQTKGYTGADIAGICREAKTQALEQELNTGKEGSVTTDIVVSIITNVKPSGTDDVVAQYQAFLNKFGQR